jgi:hypothetical protein
MVAPGAVAVVINLDIVMTSPGTVDMETSSANETVSVKPGRVVVTTSPSDKTVTVEPGAVIVVNEPEIEVVYVDPGTMKKSVILTTKEQKLRTS